MSNPKYKNPFSATLNGILDLFRKQTPIGILKDNERLEGKTCLVTGANSGLGYAIARGLLDKGAFVVLACRSQIEETRKSLLLSYPQESFKILHLDLTQERSILDFAAQIKANDFKFDVAVFNAAMVPGGSKQLDNGLDEMFMVNYLSNFILVNALLKEQVFQTSQEMPARIIFISSESHRTNKEIDLENLGKFESYTMAKVIELYGYYKLMLNTFLVELARRLDADKANIDVFAMCPGPVNTNIARKAPSWATPLIKVIFKLFFSSPEKAAMPTMYLACAHNIAHKKQLYLHLMQQKAMDAKALDPKTGEALWAKSKVLVEGLKP